jgi:hypothetical protein
VRPLPCIQHKQHHQLIDNLGGNRCYLLAVVDQRNVPVFFEASSTLLMPTSMTTQPGLSQDPLT